MVTTTRTVIATPIYENFTDCTSFLSKIIPVGMIMFECPISLTNSLADHNNLK